MERYGARTFTRVFWGSAHGRLLVVVVGVFTKIIGSTGARSIGQVSNFLQFRAMISSPLFGGDFIFNCLFSFLPGGNGL